MLDAKAVSAYILKCKKTRGLNWFLVKIRRLAQFNMQMISPAIHVFG